MRPQTSSFAWLSQQLPKLGIGFVLLTVATAFRCPGPDPAEGPDGGGGDGGGISQGGAGQGGAGQGGAGVTTGTGGSGGSGGCDAMIEVDPDNCGACGRACSLEGVLAPQCNQGECVSTCVSGRINFDLPAAPAADDGCETLGQRAFITSLPVLADFGGAIAGDLACQQFANGSLLGGKWMSWTSDEGTSPATRFVQSSSPYYRLDQTIIANNWGELTSGSLLAAIALDNNAASASGIEVWTGTDISGNYSGLDCYGWTDAIQAFGEVGLSSDQDAGWTSVFQQYCDRDNVRLYCFEQ